MPTRPPAPKPLKLRRIGKRGVRTQFGALCWRMKKGKIQVCLVTSRTTGRWIIPKGWPMHKQTPPAAAATEAFEEAGISGTASDHCIGVYSYIKSSVARPHPVVVLVYPLAVGDIHDVWPESEQRTRKWFSCKKAAKKVAEPALRQIILTFDPAIVPA